MKKGHEIEKVHVPFCHYCESFSLSKVEEIGLI